MHNSTYERIRCPVCGHPWEEHRPECSRHDYRPTLRIDSEGRDVTDLPGLWDESDRFFTEVEYQSEYLSVGESQ